MHIEVRKPTEEEKKKAQSWLTWKKEVSTFPWAYDEQETCHILEGRGRVEGKNGEVAEFGAGDFVVFPEGLECVWTVLEPIKKRYKFGKI